MAKRKSKSFDTEVSSGRVEVRGGPPKIKAPPTCSPAAAVIFETVIAHADPKQFVSNDVQLIEQYAESVAMAQAATAAIHEEGTVVVGSTGSMVRNPHVDIWQKASKQAHDLARALRLTPNARMNANTAGRRAAGSKQLGKEKAKPIWEDDA